MVLTKDELIGWLKTEVRILVHLAGKVDRAKLDYRPTANQRSTLELLQYLAIMGPINIAVIKGGVFDRAAFSAAWTPAEQAAKEMTFDQAVAEIERLSGEYPKLLEDWSDDDFRSEVDMFGTKSTRGSLLVEHGAQQPRGLSNAIILLSEILRPRRTRYDEPLGRHGFHEARRLKI